MVDKEKAGEAIHSFLEALGLDLTELDMEKTPQRVADMVFGAMSQVVPHKVMAGSNSSITGIYFGGVDPKTHEYYVYMETFGGGSGARYNKDGLDAIQVHMTNTSNLPVEALEMEYPLTICRCFCTRFLSAKIRGSG